MRLKDEYRKAVSVYDCTEVYSISVQYTKDLTLDLI